VNKNQVSHSQSPSKFGGLSKWTPIRRLILAVVFISATSILALDQPINFRLLGEMVITSQPSSLSVAIGSSATFSVSAAGGGPVTYQWYVGNYLNPPSAVPGATNASLTLTNVQMTNAGIYTVAISNPWGTVTSAKAGLNIKRWLALGRKAGSSGSGNLPSDPYDCDNPTAYTAIIATNRPYCSFYYLSNGTYYTHGGGYHLVDTNADGSIYIQATAWEGCKHYGQGPTNTIIKLLPWRTLQTDLNTNKWAYAHIIFGPSDFQWTPGFELHDLKLDVNATNQPDWAGHLGSFGAVAASGSYLLFSNLVVTGFGTAQAGVECFPFNLGTVASVPTPVENIRITDCTFTAPVAGNRDGATCSLIETYRPAYSKDDSTLVVTNCVFANLKSDFIYSHAVHAPTVVNCRFTNCSDGFYLETATGGGWDPRDFLHNFLISGNQFANVDYCVQIINQPGHAFVKGLTIVGNTLLMNTNALGHFGFVNTLLNPLSAPYPQIGSVVIASNTVKFMDGLLHPAGGAQGFNLSFIGALNVHNNVSSLGNHKDFVVWTNTIPAKVFTNNVDAQGNPLLISDNQGNLYPQSSPPP